MNPHLSKVHQSVTYQKLHIQHYATRPLDSKPMGTGCSKRLLRASRSNHAPARRFGALFEVLSERACWPILFSAMKVFPVSSNSDEILKEPTQTYLPKSTNPKGDPQNQTYPKKLHPSQGTEVQGAYGDLPLPGVFGLAPRRRRCLEMPKRRRAPTRIRPFCLTGPLPNPFLIWWQHWILL